ncbi:tRNA (adenosine(37)-N6)-threonylcarbamoyltransferase complex dimerization subunit type 1 TsaB [Hyphobacterium marinum]|uniref:tRNA (Adenosine(37)-N6)-threonylcarbamoyltransferase complex dimerization subunit type 1 TsaB n=1 Tax=Hyphobacterium marinum TaxID=3116574 RepID=A0ABU7LV57_9PROT|nr:tRNA (adenosine(37)-N6)-threonylcarbamoyltransferase complex dimerization subunit type 1 TsaB [Hyphobacterium sp. Y6023]MEE2565436.1 tRNA (adenosine(37)-N6)-threonylcarbamoyltransferase complex dimerization subunit type 1 TsaB [Hyphobacterium sp. Y6023]
MRLLVIDTTGPACSVALRLPGAADRLVSETIGRGHAERLAPMVETLLAEAGILARDLDRIGVTTGPGSFAGVRVGVAFARGLSLATGAPAVGVSTLAVRARQADPTGERRVAIVHDARRGERVVQAFDRGRPAGDPETIAAAEEDGWRARHNLHDREAETPLDLTVLLDACEMVGEADVPPSPFYARPPDAKLPGGRAP